MYGQEYFSADEDIVCGARRYFAMSTTSYSSYRKFIQNTFQYDVKTSTDWSNKRNGHRPNYKNRTVEHSPRWEKLSRAVPNLFANKTLICASEVQVKMSEKGFFKKFHETVTNSLDDVTKNNFDNLETNSKRVSYLCSLPVVKNYDLSSDLEKCQNRDVLEKDMKKAMAFKDEANKAVLKGDWGKAMQLYSLSMVYMPEKESKSNPNNE